MWYSGVVNMRKYKYIILIIIILNINNLIITINCLDALEDI